MIKKCTLLSILRLESLETSFFRIINYPYFLHSLRCLKTILLIPALTGPFVYFLVSVFVHRYVLKKMQVAEGVFNKINVWKKEKFNELNA